MNFLHLVFTRLFGLTEQKECEDPFITQFKCDTELPCPEKSAKGNAPKVFMEWGQNVEF